MWLYNFGLTCYVWIIRLVAPRHPKARLWIHGRTDLYKRMAETIDPAARIVWIHVASLGEFEQGRPIIERIRKEHPECQIKTQRADGLRECRKLLMLAKAGKLDGYLLEGMACPGGCVAGAGTVVSADTAAKKLAQHMTQASGKTAEDSKYRDLADQLN